MAHQHPTRNEKAIVIVLVGPSSAGKTAIARELQTILPVPAIYFEADRVFPELPKDHPGWSSAVARHGAVQIAFNRAVAAWASDGFNVIVDGSIPQHQGVARDQALDAYSSYDCRVVAVTAADATLAGREKSRVDFRAEGTAIDQRGQILSALNVDAIVDTSHRGPRECAADVAVQLGLT